MNITQERLKELLHYDPETGIFTAIHSRYWSKKDTLGIPGKCGYARISVDNYVYKAHRLAWLYITGAFPKDQIDHINHVPSDNRFCNLRDVTNEENSHNMKMNKRNTSGVTGVRKAKNRWRVSINHNKKLFYNQTFASKHKAIAIRKALEVMLGYHNNHGSSP